ncbi:MAG: hydroxyacylglutathione hydrolase [Methylococcaceae bacterium TMED69]|nr:MAG: hydroxyacylglutathione hydrolase [Methylococcaceae bacterium TMED69]
MDNFQIHMVPCLSDNYGFILSDADGRTVISIDTPDENVIMDFLEKKGWGLSYILNTHHHHDHVGGNIALKRKWGCYIFCSTYDFENKRIPGADEAVKDGDNIQLGDFRIKVLDVPGHTLGHVAYYFPDQNRIFVGDTLFALGCGRLFEGTPAIMCQSLDKIKRLPDETLIYCAHEYTKSNLEFALEIEPGNEDLACRRAHVLAKREKGLPTVPTTIAEEKKTNPFLRSHSKLIRDTIGMNDSSNIEVFTEVRKRKDSF